MCVGGGGGGVGGGGFKPPKNLFGRVWIFSETILTLNSSSDALCPKDFDMNNQNEVKTN